MAVFEKKPLDRIGLTLQQPYFCYAHRCCVLGGKDQLMRISTLFSTGKSRVHGTNVMNLCHAIRLLLACDI
jgi:hypothetical protein